MSRFRKKKPYYRKRRSSTNFEKRVRAIAKKVNKVDKEIKTIDTSYGSNDPINGTSYFMLLSGVAQGDTADTREGNQISIRSVQIRGYVESDDTPVNDTVCRIIIFRWRRVEGAANPVIADLLDTDWVNELRNWAHRKDFRILWDKRILLPKIPLATCTSKRLFEKYIKFKNPIIATFEGAAAPVANCLNNHLFMCLMCDQANLSQANWEINNRVTFTD